MRRILVGFIMNGKAGGIDKYLLNFLESICQGEIHEEVRIDFLTNEVDEELREYLVQYHSELYEIASLKHPLKQFRQVCDILGRKHYDMAYLNVSTAIDCVAAFAAKKAGISERVIHSHSSGNDCESALQRFVYNIIHRVCKTFFYKAGTRFYGCSVKAGEWVLPKKIVNSEQFEVIYNAVDGNKFQYNPAVRTEVRQELELEDEKLFVIGHIGNFCYVKNYPFLIEVFEQIYNRNKGSRLLLVGTGVELEDVKKIVKEKKLEKVVQFLGWRSDTERLYQGMDLFLLPSRFEGLPVVGVEAQYTKLPCVLSDSITREAKIQDHCYFLPLTDGPKKWAEFILQHSTADRHQIRLTEEASHYNLDTQKEQLRRIVCH